MLDTQRLIIRPFRKNDYQDIYEYMSIPETYRFERGKPMSLDEAKKFCAEFTGKTGPGFWAATLRENHKLIGHVSFFPEGPEFLETWQIGFIFNPIFQNKGYCSEASLTVIRYALKKLSIHRIVAHCSPDNIPSWKVLEKCGMRREGYLRKNFTVRNDENEKPAWNDSYAYGILEEDII